MVKRLKFNCCLRQFMHFRLITLFSLLFRSKNRMVQLKFSGEYLNQELIYWNLMKAKVLEIFYLNELVHPCFKGKGDSIAPTCQLGSSKTCCTVGRNNWMSLLSSEASSQRSLIKCRGNPFMMNHFKCWELRRPVACTITVLRS